MAGTLLFRAFHNIVAYPNLGEEASCDVQYIPRMKIGSSLPPPPSLLRKCFFGVINTSKVGNTDDDDDAAVRSNSASFGWVTHSHTPPKQAAGAIFANIYNLFLR